MASWPEYSTPVTPWEACGIQTDSVCGVGIWTDELQAWPPSTRASWGEVVGLLEPFQQVLRELKKAVSICFGFGMWGGKSS